MPSHFWAVPGEFSCGCGHGEAETMSAQTVLAPSLGRGTLGRSAASRRWLSAVSPRTQLLGTAFGYNVISQASLCIWFMPSRFITVVGIDIHWAHTGLEGSSALPDLYVSIPHVLKWQCQILMRCILLVPGFLGATGDGPCNVMGQGPQSQIRGFGSRLCIWTQV